VHSADELAAGTGYLPLDDLAAWLAACHELAPDTKPLDLHGVSIQGLDQAAFVRVLGDLVAQLGALL
jgi:hypothetical protein